ncbi:uncharacterized protein LY89DRAFT_51239 [Mollisia scopiformis]|uniref:Uncharacterized protein n=1 Tax=Mollisia scopiformis TaxID=149040 RepID=A0A194XB06_MOLSC|nr:uncharacterized protein LY89DRAFT_51239 [Mollisia scopiformis]KUJ17329.1 hypothetical protein LY89DRAFT_51239 [Mollisia scopiformis]
MVKGCLVAFDNSHQLLAKLWRLVCVSAVFLRNYMFLAGIVLGEGEHRLMLNTFEDASSY